MVGNGRGGGGGYVLLSDAPRSAPPAGAAPSDDVLGFTELSGRMADLIVESRRSTPLALGVLGGWGSGKSTLMRHVDAALTGCRPAERVRVETVWFNAWVAEETQVLEGMIKLVLSTIGPKVVRRALRNKRLIGGLRLVTTMALSWFGAGRLIDSVWDTLSADAKARNDLRDLLGDAMREWQRGRAAKGERLLVIFVDDLDRCSPDKVVDVFEAIKVYLDEPGFVFVIGYDQAMVGSAIRADKSLDALRTAQYLEKIVQIECRVPRPDDAQARALVDALVAGSGTGSLLGDSERTLILDRTDRNPRRVKRFLNNFVLSQRLDPTVAEFGAAEHIKVLLLRMYFPEFYELLFEDGERDAFTEFLDYARFEESVLRGKPLSAEESQAIFHTYRRSPPAQGETLEAALERLRQVVAEPMIPLAANPDFRSLVESLGDADARRDLLDRVRGRRDTFEAVPAEGSAAQESAVSPEVTERTLAGLRVLWIDDEPRNNADEAADLVRLGGEVVEVRSLEEAEAVLSGGAAPFDLLISDVTRHGDPEAGFRDLATLRDEHRYDGPVFFYTTRVTAERRKRARELGALGIGGDTTPAWVYLEERARERGSSAGGLGPLSTAPPAGGAIAEGVRRATRAKTAARG